MADIDWKSDALIGWFNLVEKEIHSTMSWMITREDFWLDEINFAREERAELTKELGLKMEDVGQGHCDNKHDGDIIIRNMEVGAKFLSNGDKETAKKYYERAFNRLERFIIRNELDKGDDEQEDKKESFFQKVKNKLKGEI